MNKGLLRARWAALGAAVAVSLGGGAMWMVDAAPAGSGVEFVAISPCRLLATRPAPSTVGARSAPLGAAEAWATAVWGTNGNCTIPTTATAVSLNVTALAGTASSNLTVYPADAGRPGTSNLNWRAGDGPTPNAVTVGLSATGSIGIYNAAGTVQVIVDIVGYYKAEAKPAQIVTVAKSGGDFTTITAALASITDSGYSKPYVIEVAPGTYTEPAGVELKDYVEIHGSGEDMTRVTCTCSSAVDPVTGAAGAAGAVFRSVGAVTATVSDLDINSSSANTWNDGVDIINAGSINAASITLRNVTVTGQGATNSVAVFVSHTRVTLDHVTAQGYSNNVAGGTGAGLYLQDGAYVIVNDSTLRGAQGAVRSTGAHVQASSLFLNNTFAWSSGVSNSFGLSVVSLSAADSQIDVTDSELQGTTNSINAPAGISMDLLGGWLKSGVGGGGSFRCAGVANGLTNAMLSTACA